MTTTLVLSTWSLPAARPLADAARGAGWGACALDETVSIEGDVLYYGATDRALEAADRFRLALLEPPFDLLARLPAEFRRRAVEFARFGDLGRLKAPTFVKPADALDKAFDAGVYANARDIRAPKGVDADSPVLLSEPVEWSAEYRCFVLDGEVAAWSPYISFGRPSWKPFGRGTRPAQAPAGVRAFCERLLRSGVAFPPAFVVDVGPIDDRGWAVVEFNPVWSSGLLGADPGKVLEVLRRACRPAAGLGEADRRWVVNRPTAPAAGSRTPRSAGPPPEARRPSSQGRS
jgi:ATP-grasp domain, R2K clade family 2